MSTREHALRIMLLMVFVLTVQGWMLARNMMPAQDGINFIRIARNFSQTPLPTAIQSSSQHPLYPWLVSVTQRVLFLQSDSETWLHVARGVAAAGCVLLVIPMYLTGLRMGDERTAFTAPLFFSVIPVFARVSVDCMAESSYLLFFMIGVYGVLEFLRKENVWWLVLAGIGSGISYWSRPEGVILTPTILIALFVSPFLRTLRIQWGRVIAGGTILVMTTLLVVAPYMLLTGRMTQKNSLNHMLRKIIPASDQVTQAAGSPVSSSVEVTVQPSLETRPTALSLPADDPLDFSSKHSVPGLRFQGYLPAMKELIEELLEGFHYVFLPLALLGTMHLKEKRERLFIMTVIVVFLIALVQFSSGSGYLSTRHVITIVCMGMYPAIEGIHVLAQKLVPFIWWLTKNRRSEDTTGALDGRKVPSLQRKCFLLLTCVLTLFCLARSVAPLHASRQGHLKAGYWLAEQASEHDLLLDTRGWVSLFSDLPAYSAHGSERAFRDARLTHVVLEEEEYLAETPRGRTFRRLLDVAGRRIGTFSVDGRPGTRVLIYQWRSEQMASFWHRL